VTTVDEADKKLNYLYCVSESLQLIFTALNGDKKKTGEWFYASNPSLDGKFPMQLIREGNAPELLEFIEQAIADKDIERLNLPVDKNE